MIPQPCAASSVSLRRKQASIVTAKTAMPCPIWVVHDDWKPTSFDRSVDYTRNPTRPKPSLHEANQHVELANTRRG